MGHILKNHDELPTLVGVLTHEAQPISFAVGGQFTKAIPFNDEGYYVVESGGYKIIVEADTYNIIDGMYICDVLFMDSKGRRRIQYVQVTKECVLSDQFVEIVLSMIENRP